MSCLRITTQALTYYFSLDRDFASYCTFVVVRCPDRCRQTVCMYVVEVVHNRFILWDVAIWVGPKAFEWTTPGSWRQVSREKFAFSLYYCITAIITIYEKMANSISIPYTPKLNHVHCYLQFFILIMIGETWNVQLWRFGLIFVKVLNPTYELDCICPRPFLCRLDPVLPQASPKHWLQRLGQLAEDQWDQTISVS